MDEMDPSDEREKNGSIQVVGGKKGNERERERERGETS